MDRPSQFLADGRAEAPHRTGNESNTLIWQDKEQRSGRRWGDRTPLFPLVEEIPGRVVGSANHRRFNRIR